MTPPAKSKRESRQPEPAGHEPLYSDPFAGSGYCQLALAVREEDRAAVTQSCPRCGSRRDPIATPEAAACILEGVELDLMAVEALGERPKTDRQ